MAAPVLIPDNETVYRGMANSNWCKHEIVSYKAFMLRPATAQYPAAEAELSLGRSAASAVDELREHHGAAALSVAAVHDLTHNLRIQPDADDAMKAELHGLPLFSTDPIQRDRAVTMATDLAGLSRWVAVPPAN
jgi:hypothetical protein